MILLSSIDLAKKNNEKICFDLDGVICTTKNADYKKSQPKKEIINLINKLYKKYYILIFTARYG